MREHGPLQSVVIVDDEPDHAAIIQHVLADVAPLARVAVIGELGEARRRLTDIPRGSLLLVDRQIGGEDSIALLPAALEARPDLTVVVLSAALSDADRDRGMSAGASVVEEKPGSLEGWRALLRRAIALHEARGQG